VDELSTAAPGAATRPGDDDRSRAGMDLIIVTGLSGAGRSTVARALENVGYYVVDNLPQALMVTMAELAYQSGGQARRTAMILDVRSRAFSTDLTGAVADLRARGFPPVRERPPDPPAAGRRPARGRDRGRARSPPGRPRRGRPDDRHHAAQRQPAPVPGGGALRR
jgi:hypothetical protein